MPIYTGDKFGFGKAPEDGAGEAQPGEAFFPEPGQYDWVCPEGVTKVCAVCIGGGGGATRDEMGGAGGGGLGYKNNISVTPGETYKIQVGAGGVGDVYMNNYGTSGGDSWFINATTVKGGGGGGTGCGADGDHTVPGYGGRGGTYVGDSGGNGGNGGDGNRSSISGTGNDTGGGGAGGYGGDGGRGGDSGNHLQNAGTAGNAGGGGGGCTTAGGSHEYWGGGGGGVSVYGKGRNGTTGSTHQHDWQSGGVGGSGGAAGWGNGGHASGYAQVNGGQYGGGGGSTDQRGGHGASGAVRLIWGTGRAFPSTAVDDFWSETITRYTASTAEDTTATSSNWFRGGIGEEDNSSYGSNYNYNGIVPNIAGHSNLTGDLTVECWIYVERVADGTQAFGSGTDGWGSCIMDGRGTGNSGGNYLGSWWISRGDTRRGSTGPYFLNYGATSSPSSTMTSDTECIQQCTWHHVAITRQNNVWWMWVDGVKVKASDSPGSGGEGATPATLSVQSDRPVIGGWGYGGRMAFWSFYGNISNFRISKNIALYDGSNSTYTVPTFPLTTTLPGGGNAVSSHSVNFSSGNDYLTVSSSNQMSMGTDDFTIECWARFDDTSNRGLWQIEGLTTNHTVTLAFAHNGGNWHGYRGGSTWNFGSSRNTNHWYHCAYVRHSGTCYIYVDGTSIGSWSDSYNYQGTTLAIGGYYTTSYLMHGNISNFRMVKGQALYTSNFTPPTTPLTNISGTVLLCCNQSSPTGSTITPATISNGGGSPTGSSEHPFGATGPSVEVLCCGVQDDYEKDLTGSRVWSGPNCMPSVLGPGEPTSEVMKKGYRIWGRHRGLGGGTKTGNNGDPGDGGLLSTWKKPTGSFQTEQFGTHGGWSAQSHTADGVSIKVTPKNAYATGDNASAKWNLKSISYGVPTYRPRNNSLGFGPFIPNVQIKVMAGKNSGDTVIYDSGAFTLRLPSYNWWDSEGGTPSKERYTSCAFEIELPNGGVNNLDMDTWYSVYIKGLVHPNNNNWNSTNGSPGSNKQNFWYSESPVSYSSNSGTYNEMRYAPSTSGDTDSIEIRLEAANFNDTSWANSNHGSFQPLGQFPFFGISMPINFMQDPIPSGGGGGGGGATYVTNGLIFNVDASDSSSYSGSGNTWIDIQGSNNVSLTNCSYSSSHGGGITFDGVSQWSIGEFTTPFTANQPHTWEVWTNGEWTTGWPGSQYTWILHNSSQGQSTGSSYMTIGINDGNHFFGALDGKYGSMSDSNQNSTNSTVHHLILTWDGSTQKFYVNGNLGPSYNTPAYSSWQNNSSFNTTTTMGEAIGGNYRPLKGNIYSVRAWDRALTAAEVSTNWDGNKEKFGYGDIDQTGLIHYWNATAGKTGSNYVVDSVGNNTLTSQWGNVSHESTRGGQIHVPNTDSTGWWSFDSDVRFGSGESSQEFTHFWCGQRDESPWWMWATGSDGNNFIGYSGGTLRIDSNQDTKGDLSYSSMSTGNLYCVYMTIDSGGSMSWYVNGNHVGNNNYSGSWSSHNVIFDSLNHYDSGGSLQSGGKFCFAGFYNRALSESEISSNWAIHQTRLGI